MIMMKMLRYEYTSFETYVKLFQKTKRKYQNIKTIQVLQNYDCGSCHYTPMNFELQNISVS
jgi:hypothetical protein